MKISETYNSVECDCCYTKIEARAFLRNDGSYQSDTIKFKGLDICHVCASRLFERYQEQIDVDVDTLKECFVPMGKQRIKLPDLFNFFKGDTNESK